ncbi:MAG TPA: EAL domain-containing response regulator [Albitalea sp.]|nr:EAL domain-containing response regulator [Albitalea sp.]
MSFASLRLLVAEDHDFQRRVVIGMLERLGVQTIHEAADGRAALDVIQDPARPVDIVISDLEMPGMDGMEFIRHLGQAGAGVSLILASALERKLLASVATMAEAYGMRLLGVAEKPISLERLRSLIESHAAAAPRAAPAPPSFTLAQIDAGLRNDEFEPFFQPKVEVATRRVKGAEALARWRHPQLGIVAPFAFIPLLEQNKLIDELTWSILRRSAAQCLRWHAAGFELNVSVNLSLASLADVHLANRVTEIVRAEGLAPRHVVLEITESAAGTDLGKALENLARLRVKGFGLSIDDYGTGYSSMQQLSRIAFTELKIDRAFVANAAHDKSARVILASSLDMARELGLVAVAEGVETEADWALLAELGCELAQGYLIARPMDGKAFEDWVRAAVLPAT